MSDADLEEIRRARLQQLQQQGNDGGGGQGGGVQDDQDQKRQNEAEARSHILNQILEPDAADRLGRIRLVKEQRATDVENKLIMLARSGQIRQKVNEEQLKDILAQVSEQTNGQQERVVIKRTKPMWDEDDDDVLDL